MVVNDTTKRIRAVITHLSDFIATAGNENQKRMSRIMAIMIDEVSEELGERDERQMQRWMIFMSRILEWSGTGNIAVLPQELIPFVADVEHLSVEEVQRRWEEATGMSYGEDPMFPPDDEVIDAEIVEEIG